MRVISGSARGKKLFSPIENHVRPTADRVKEAIFSAIQFELAGKKILDLFAGTGQIGIEALSRGAEFAAFVDKSLRSVQLTKKNLEAAGFSERAKLFGVDAAQFLSTCTEKFDIIFLDPPYKDILDANFWLILRKCIEPGGLAIYESAKASEKTQIPKGFELRTRRGYGTVTVEIYKKRFAHEDR